MFSGNFYLKNRNKDPLWENVILYLRGNGVNDSLNIVDTSLSQRNLTLYGGVKNSSVQSLYNGSSLFFDRIDDYIAFTNNLQLLSNKYTLEAWVYPVIAADMAIFSSTPNVTGVGRLLLMTADRKLNFVSGGGVGLSSSTELIVLNQWNHLAVMVSGASNSPSAKTYLCVNGISKQVPNITSLSEGSIWAIGKNNRSDQFIFWFGGYMGPIRITRGVDRPYDANFDPISDTYFFR